MVSFRLTPPPPFVSNGQHLPYPLPPPPAADVICEQPLTSSWDPNSYQIQFSNAGSFKLSNAETNFLGENCMILKSNMSVNKEMTVHECISGWAPIYVGVKSNFLVYQSSGPKSGGYILYAKQTYNIFGWHRNVRSNSSGLESHWERYLWENTR